MTWKRGRAVAAPSSSAPAAMRDRAPRRGRQRAPPPARPLGAARGWLRPRRGVQAATGGLPRPHTKTWPTCRLLDPQPAQPIPFPCLNVLSNAIRRPRQPPHCLQCSLCSYRPAYASLCPTPTVSASDIPYEKAVSSVAFLYSKMRCRRTTHGYSSQQVLDREFTCQTDPKDSWARPWIAFVLGTERGNAALGKKIACDHVDRGGVAI